MSNFEGIQKNAKGFKPQQRAGDGAGVGKTVAGLWPGQEPVTVFEKANQPVLDTDKTPRTDGVGEGELGLRSTSPGGLPASIGGSWRTARVSKTCHAMNGYNSGTD